MSLRWWALAAVASACHPSVYRCRAAATAELWEQATVLCAAAFDETGDASTGVTLARAYLYRNDDTRAREVAERLLATPRRADALSLVGTLADRRRNGAEAQAALEEARRLHAAQGNRRMVARDAHALAGVLAREGRYRPALEAVRIGLREAASAGDERMTGFCYLALGDILTSIGDAASAERALLRAGELLRGKDLVYVRFKTGRLYHDQLGRPLLAEPPFREVVALGANAPADLVESARLHLADIYRQTGRLDEAAAMLEQARGARPQVATNERYVYHLAQLQRARGQPLAARGTLLALVERDRDSDWPWKARYELGLLQEEAGDDAGAESTYRATIDTVEKLRGEAGAPELRSWILAERRGPYEALFALLVRGDRLDEALAVLEAMSGRAWLEQMLFRRGSDDEVARAGAVEDLVPALVMLPTARISDGRALLSSLGPREVLAHVVAHGRVFGVRATAGGVVIRDLAAWDELVPWLRRFEQDPNDRAAAERLGATLLPEDLAPVAPAPLHVLASAAFASFPYTALRRNGRYFVEDRSLALVPNLSALGHAAEPESYGASVVIGDPRGDLPGARGEATAVGRRLDAKVLRGAAATRAAIAAAGNAEVLHVAAHAGFGAQGAWLELADGPVPAVGLLKMALRPRLVVLATCGSAISRDPERLGALASAFLAGGATHVLATSWVVADEAVRPVVEAFYDEGGRADPVEALARVQRTLARTLPPSRWAPFVVYGIGGPRRLVQGGGSR